MSYHLELDTPHKTDEVPARAPMGMLVDSHELNILLVEDVASDAMLTRLALDETNIPYNLFTLRKGSQLLSHLAKYNLAKFTGEEAMALPDLILLDLGLPGMSGFDILESLTNAHAMIRAVPIIILSGYEHFDYLTKNNNLYIPAYMNKPCDPVKMRKIMASIHRDRPLSFPAGYAAD